MNPGSQAEVAMTGQSAAPTDLPIAALFAPVEDALREVERRLEVELASNAPFVDELLRYVGGLGGKRLRPALMLLTGKAVGRLSPQHITLAAVMEMIHVATLVHDDVLDQAATRRHLATVNARWGAQASVLLGDYLFTHAFHLASTCDSTYACRTIGRSTNSVCEGELRQVGHQGNWQLTESDYLEIIGDKTAELCACCCELGAHYAGADTQLVEAMRCFGFDLGVAFQIADDVLDLTGDEDATGKSLGTDMANQKATLPIIRYLEICSDRAEWLERLRDSSMSQRWKSELLAELTRSGSLQYARDRAMEYSLRATQRLELLPPSNARDVLDAVTRFVVYRLH